MALHVHRAGRTDLLADGLAALLADPLPDPFAQELVLVPARGVERWLSQRLSHALGRRPGHDDGVCAGVTFRNPGALISEISGISGPAGDDPWSPDALTWPLLRVIDRSLDEPWCRPLASHLGHFDTDDLEAEPRRARRYAVARRLAGLFASYARQRPQLPAEWLDGGSGGVDADLAWQPHLWRALVAAVPADPPHVRHDKTVARLREGPADLPARLSLFGHTRLARTDIELLEALSSHHDLHLWLPHPSDALWRALGGHHGVVRRRDDDSRAAARHPLLETLGRDLRELQRALPAGPATDEFLRAPARPDTLLGWLQSDIEANAPRPAGRAPRPGDRSVQVHACHGPSRQVDVLRDVLLGLLDDDPTLQPRDIVVMCPDVENYAPLFVAAFGLGEAAGEGHPSHQLRVKLADRALTQTNPLLDVAAQLLALAGARATAGQVLNLARAAPVRARFGFTGDDLNVITGWVRESNIRWGFDQRHRRPYGLGHVVHNTWRFGMDRILTGVAMSDDSRAWLDTALPLDDVGSNEAELAGRLAEFVARLHRVTGNLSNTQPLTGWLNALIEGVGLLTRADDTWQESQLRWEFSEVLRQAGSHCQTPLRAPDVRALLDQLLAGRPTRANFRTGTLTVCTMVPMRSVPHRVVCLVGLDDKVFPRLDISDSDDALGRDPRTGERDIRSEDRQLLLDAIGAATETLVVTYTGADEHTGQLCPPAVPLAEVLDALDRTTETPVREQVVTRHPLQPFDVRNVRVGGLVPGRPFTFDPAALAAAEAAAGTRRAPMAFLSEPLPALPAADVSLADLLDFFRDPVKGFFRALDWTLPWDVDTVREAMPVEIDPLREWTVGERMLRDMLAGAHPDDAANAEWRRGTLPPGRLGMRTAREIRDRARELAAAAMRHRDGDGDGAAHDVDVALGDGRWLTGTVTPVFGARLVTVRYAKLAPKHVLASWIDLVALAARRPEIPWTALCIGRGTSKNPIAQRLFVPPPAPVEVLRDLVALYDTGRREPLPLPLKTSYAWAQARRDGQDPDGAAREKWRGNGFAPGDGAERAHVRVWGQGAPLSVLLEPPSAGEETPGEHTRLGALAARLWLPVLAGERNP